MRSLRWRGEFVRERAAGAVWPPQLLRHLELVQRHDEEDVAHGAGWVELPDALACKYANAGSAV